MNNIKLFDKNSNLNLIVKTPGISCNINCDYCFEKCKNATKKFLSPDVLENIIERVPCQCSLVFHGGEPLIIGIERFKALLNVVQRYYPQKVTSVKVQTNGTLLNNGWINLLFKEYSKLKIEIAISLDGTFEMNSLRVDNNNNPTYQSVINAFYLLNKNGVSAGMLSVISKRSLTYPEEYVKLLSQIENLRFVKINGLFNIENNELTRDSILPSEYSKFIIEVANFYIKNGLYKKFPIEPILSILQKINNKSSRYCNYSKRKCFNFISVYPDGTLAPCDCLSVNEFMINSSSEKLVDCIEATINSPNGQNLTKITDYCEKCDIYNFCTGGCLSQRYYFRNNSFLSKDFCESKHILYNNFMNLKRMYN